MKEKLMKLLKAKNEQRSALNKSMVESDSKEERAAIGATLEALEQEIAEVKAMLDEIDEPAPEANPDEERSFNVLAAMEQRQAAPQKKNVNKYDTEEYRKAFMEFCKRGTPIPAE